MKKYLFLAAACLSFAFTACSDDNTQDEGENTAPTCKITEPLEGETYDANLPLTIKGRINDKENNVSAVKLTVGGETVDEASLAVEHLDRFGKLNSAAQLLKSAIAGDAKALERLEKQAAAAEADQNRICSELEKLVGVKQEPEEAAPALDLAAELQAAIAGNFAKSSARAVEKVVDPKQLLSEYLNTGLVDAETLERSFERFDNAYGKLR